MDKTLKILLACLGIAAMAIFMIPSGDPLASAPPANPAAPGAPTAPSEPGKEGTPGPVYTPPNSEAAPQPQNPPGTADSSDLQQSTFGQPMFDPRPASERKTEEGNAERPEQVLQPQPGVIAQPGYYNGPAPAQPAYPAPANNLGYDPQDIVRQ